jgi:tetratricopeptide (TPR) repeat protein
MLRSKTIVFALFLAAVIAAPAEAKRASLSGNLLAGQAALNLRDPEAAGSYFAEALRQDPNNSALVERLFQVKLSIGDMAGAEQFASRILKFNSQHRMARLVLGLKDFKARRYEAARQHFSEASYTPVGELTSALLVAWSYAGEGSMPAAMRALDKLDGNDSFANFKSFHAALIADYLKSSIRADAAYKKAYQDAGTSLRVTQAYASFLARNSRTEEAMKVYADFLAGGERNALVEEARRELAAGKIPKPFIETPQGGAGEALFSLAAAMNDDQSIDLALLYGQLALAFNADKPVMLTMLGDILTTAQRFEYANTIYDRIEPKSVLRANADTEVALNLQRLERKPEAEARMKVLLAREPGNFDGWVALGSIYRNMERYADASSAYDKALKLEPVAQRSHWSVYYYRGISFERQKKWIEAEADFRKALQLSPDEPSVLNYLGYSLIDTGQKLDEALEMVKKAVDLRPNDGYIVDSLGWAYYQLGDFDNAVQHLERAVDLKPGDPVIADHLGDAYWRAGRTLEAKFQWQHSKDNKPEPEELARIEEKLKQGLPDLPPPVKPADNGQVQPSNG